MANLRYRLFLVSTAFLMLAMPVGVADAGYANPVRPEELTTIDTGTVTEILKSDMIMLDDAKRFRLDNILVPFANAPVIEELKRELLNKKVTVYTYPDSDSTLDRYGVPLVHVVTDTGVWLQQDLISKGLVWVYCTESSQDINQKIIDILKQTEEKARKQRKGFWADQTYAVKTPDTVKSFEGSYQIVEGKILSVYVKPGSGTVFFNFGTDWKKDFSVRILSRNVNLLGLVEASDQHGKNSKSFVDEGSDPLQWKNRKVRVRGWVVGGSGGPVIDLSNKEQIDFIPQVEK